MAQQNPFENAPPPVPVAASGPPAPPPTTFDNDGSYETSNAFGSSGGAYGAPEPANQPVAPPPAPPTVPHNNNVNAFDSNSGYDDQGTYGNNDAYGASSYDTKAEQPPPYQNQNNNNVETFEVASTQNPNEEKPWGCSEYTAYCPTKYMNAFCGACFIAGAVADLFVQFTFLDLFVNTWLTLVGIIHVFIEFPRSFWNARIQDPVFKWAKFTERLWGRAFLLFIFSLLMMSDTKSSIKIALGVPAFLATFINLIVSYIAASKLHSIYKMCAAGLEEEAKYAELERRFDILDVHKTGKLRPEDIYALSQQAGRVLNSSELETIVRFFDEKFCLEIHKDDWIRGFKFIDNMGLRFL